jgi:hypothetical protein
LLKKEGKGAIKMTKSEAKRAIAGLSSGTLGNITGITNYEALDRVLAGMLDAIDIVDVSGCETWVHVVEVLKKEGCFCES